jgi:hypothetical protein
VAQELIYFLDKLLYKKEQQNFIEKTFYYVLLLKHTSLPLPPQRPRSAGRLWSSAEAEKDIDVDVVFLPIFATYDILSQKPNVGNFHLKGKLIFIFILLANRPTGNNTHKKQGYTLFKSKQR